VRRRSPSSSSSSSSSEWIAGRRIDRIPEETDLHPSVLACMACVLCALFLRVAHVHGASIIIDCNRLNSTSRIQTCTVMNS
ncbi:MAG: hypothetical protein ABGY24_13135, partial [bacterium]